MNRKDLIRRYKEEPRPMGVFRVHNRVANRSYVGTSTDLPAILNRNRAQLRLGAHPNRALQQDWNALGAEAFVFEALDTLAPPENPGHDSREDLQVLERLWREKLATGDWQAY